MKHIDNLFREELGNYTEAPPPMVWDALEKRLEGDRGKRAFPYRWMLYCAVISMVLVGSGSLAWKMSNTGSEAAEAAAVEGIPATINETKASDIKPIQEPKTIALNATNTSTKTVKHHKTKTHTAHTTQTETVAVKKAVAQEAADANSTAATNANSDYDYYAAATSGDESAPAPKTKTEVEGYVVNVRRKNNIKVADMAPVEEKIAYRKPVEVQTSAENMVVSTMTTSVEAEITHTQQVTARKAGTATAAKHITATPDQGSSAKAPAAKPSAFASATNKNVTKPVTTNTISRAAATYSKPVTNNIKASAPAAVKKEQTVVTTVAAKAKAEAPVVHKVTSPAENAKAENKAPVKKVIAKTSAKVIATKHPLAATATKAPVEKTVAQKAKPAETKVSSTPASENKIPAATQPTVKKDVATKQVAAIIPSATVSVNKAAENKVAAAQPIAKKGEVANPISAIIPSPSSAINKTTAKNVATSTPAKTSKAVETKEKEIAKKEVTLEPTKFPATATPIAKTQATKSEKAIKPVLAKKEKEKKSAIAKEEQKEVTKAVDEEKATAVAEQKEAQKSAKKSVAKQGTTVAKQSTPATPTNAYAASNINAAKKVFKPSIFVEDPATISMDPFFAAAVLHNVEEAPLPGTFKEAAVAKVEQLPAPAITAQPVATVDSSAAKQAAWRNKITGGIKLGVEGTYSGDGARRAVVSPYLEYKMNDRMSFLFQPTLKLSNLSNRTLNGTQSYTKVNGDGRSELIGTDTILVAGTPGVIIDTLLRRNYSYSQSHDSIVKSYGIGGNYFDFDIPLMMKYQLSKKFSVYGGVNLSFHKLSINTNTYNSGPIVVKVDTFTMAKGTASTPAEPPVSSVIRYGTSTTAPQNPYAQPKGELNIGYMVGFSYEFRRRCLFDALIHQGFAKSNEVGGYNINTAFSLPYLRLTLGYRLMK